MHFYFVQKVVEWLLVLHRGHSDILCNEWLKNLNCLQQSTVEYNGNINSAFPSWECSRAVFIGTFSPERKASMFPTSDLASFRTIIEQKYLILTSNCHDITIRSVLTGHEWDHHIWLREWYLPYTPSPFTNIPFPSPARHLSIIGRGSALHRKPWHLLCYEKTGDDVLPSH